VGGARIDLPLMIVHRVLKLDHLHLGLCEPGQPLDYPGIFTAQRRFTENLIAHLPQGVRSVLDVGCGVGHGTRMLRDAGYAVEGVNPDPYQRTVFTGHLPDVPFHPVTFEAFRASRLFDVVLFSESAQYVALEPFFPRCRAALDPAGARTVLVADWFLRPGVDKFYGAHPEAAFRDAAAREGFALEEEDDLTERALPMVRYLASFHRDHVIPAMDAAADIVRQEAPGWTRLIRFFAGRTLDRFARHVRVAMTEEFDPERFLRSVRYRLFRFRLAPYQSGALGTGLAPSSA